MKSEEENKRQREERETLSLLVEQTFEGFDSYISYLDKGMKGQVIYRGENVTSRNCFITLSNDFYKIISKMKETGLFTEEEIKKYRKTGEDLGCMVRLAELNVRRARSST